MYYCNTCCNYHETEFVCQVPKQNTSTNVGIMIWDDAWAFDMEEFECIYQQLHAIKKGWATRLKFAE